MFSIALSGSAENCFFRSSMRNETFLRTSATSVTAPYISPPLLVAISTRSLRLLRSLTT